MKTTTIKITENELKYIASKTIKEIPEYNLNENELKTLEEKLMIALADLNGFNMQNIFEQVKKEIEKN